MTSGSRNDPFLERATDRVAVAVPEVDIDLFRLSFLLTRATNPVSYTHLTLPTILLV